MRWLDLSFAVSLASVAAGCGASNKPPAAADESASAVLDTPETRCLAVARATRERHPNEPTKITVKHILVQFAGAKNARSEITRSRGDACLRALEARTQLQNGDAFADVVAHYSDEPGAATREGSIGSITRKDVAAPFADAAFELGRGEVSHVVETDFGYHIILRTE